VRGTCNERVTIKKDGIKLDGNGLAVLDGAGLPPTTGEFNGVMTIDGARRVVIQGFTIQNGSGEGVLARRGAAFTLRDSIVHQNGFTGVAVSDHSDAHLENLTITQNLFGLDVFNTSNAVLRGNIDVTDNFVHGITASTSSVDLRHAQLNISNNGGFGAVLNGATMAISGFDTAQGSSITANNNQCGLVAGGGGRFNIIGTPSTPPGANVITVKNNADCGIWLPGSGSLESPSGAGKFIVEGNSVGIRLGDNSTALIIGGARVQSNTSEGLLADGAGALTFVSVPPNPSVILGNGTDVSLHFGTRATFGDVTIGMIFTDGTAVCRGLPPTCP
jgi:hypothetical protein